MNPRTRIVATLGPSCSDEGTLRAMIEAGLDVVRINFSHARHDEVARHVELVRRLSRDAGQPVGILGDLRGPRIRVGEVTGGQIELGTGREVVLTPVPVVGTPERLSVSYELLTQDVDPGAILLLDDGNLELEVVRESPTGEVCCRVRRGGTLSSHRGINLPGRAVSIPSLTEKDFADVDCILAHDFDFVALSFVQRAADVAQLNAHIRARGGDLGVIAKIEKQSALDDIEAILAEAYGVMVARGDLALEVSLAEIPIAQKRIIRAARAAAKPVITATQMLESMTQSPKPTRAEVTDVANAILDGTDAIMLSGESAIGRYPVEAVRAMAAIGTRIEQSWMQGELPPPSPPSQAAIVPSVVARATHEAAERLQAAAIVTFSQNGGSARWILSHRPTIPLLTLCTNERTSRRLALSWGAEARLIPPVASAREALDAAFREVTAAGLARSGDLIAVTSGTTWSDLDRSSFLVVETVP